MLGKVDWDKCQRRYRQYWARENKDCPLLWVTAPEEGADLDLIVPHQPSQNSLSWISGPYFYPEYHKRITLDTRARWLDTGRIIERARKNFGSTYYGGEAFPLLYPDLGPDIMGGIMGCDLQLAENTTWCSPNIEAWNTPPTLLLDLNSRWWRAVEDATVEMADDAGGDYFVSITDIHPGVDSLVAMRGPENLCRDMIDCPEVVARAILSAWEPFTKIYERIHEITNRNLPGSSNWMGAWHPDRWHVVGADFMALISKKMFVHHVLPEIRVETQWLDASIFHLDGPDTLRHLDALLELPTLSGIAWLPGEGKAPISEWIPTLKKIQNAGKVIQAEVFDWEVPVLVRELEPAGVMLVTSCRTKADAAALEELVRRESRTRGHM